MARVRLTFSFLAVLLVAAACGRPDPGFDNLSLRSAIPPGLVPDDPSVVTDVTCPELRTSEAVTIICEAAIAGQPIEVTVSIESDGTASVKSQSTLIDLAGVAAEAQARFTDDLGVDSLVECPGSVVVSVADLTFECTATDEAGVSRNLVVTVVDDSGGWVIDFAH